MLSSRFIVDREKLRISIRYDREWGWWHAQVNIRDNEEAVISCFASSSYEAVEGAIESAWESGHPAIELRQIRYKNGRIQLGAGRHPGPVKYW